LTQPYNPNDDQPAFFHRQYRLHRHLENATEAEGAFSPPLFASTSRLIFLDSGFHDIVCIAISTVDLKILIVALSSHPLTSRDDLTSYQYTLITSAVRSLHRGKAAKSTGRKQDDPGLSCAGLLSCVVLQLRGQDYPYLSKAGLTG
jgi:hypothetical protein